MSNNNALAGIAVRNLNLRLLLWLAFAATPLRAQDVEWVRDWENAQRERPRALLSQARIAPQSEPGDPLIVHGRLLQADGVTPAAGAIVFAYHTDKHGLYRAAGKTGWRLKGWAVTDHAGNFEFATIRPAPYPSGSVPAHIHFTVSGGNVPRQWTEEMRFADDPLLTATQRKESEARGEFGEIRPVRREGKTQHVDLYIRAKVTKDF